MRLLRIFCGRWTLAWCLLARSSAEATVITGRVVDGTGRPVAGAEIRIWHKAKGVRGRDENRASEVNDTSAWQSDRDGHFETPNIADCGTAVRVVVRQEAMLAGRTTWIASGDQPRIDVGEVVVDRCGVGVAGVAVFNASDGHARLATTSDREGRFQLVGLPEGRICLFAEHAGFRFTGALCDAPDDAIVLRVAKVDEPIEPLKTLPRVLSPVEEEELARGMIAPLLEAAAGGDDLSKLTALFALSNLDSLAAVERIDAMPFRDLEEHQRIREEIIIAAIKYHEFDDWGDLEALIEAARLPESKAACSTYAARHLFPNDRQKQNELLASALLNARVASEAKRQALEIARIAIAHCQIGQPSTAKPLAQQALAMLDPLPVAHRVSWNTTGTVAEAVAQFDLPAARALLDRLHYTGIFGRELGRLAYDCAARDAALAERLWSDSAARPKTDADALWWRNVDLAAPLAYRLARHDPAAANRVASGLDNAAFRIAALAAMAQGMAESNADAARALARETLQTLPALGDAGTTRDYLHSMASAVCQWLPVLETLDPQLGRECLWRAAALRPPRPTVDLLDDEAELTEIHLIGMLARYDRRLAEQLLARYIATFDTAKNSPSMAGLILASAAVIDPRLAIELLTRLPATPTEEQRPAYDWARLMWTGAMTENDELRWEIVGYNDPARYESWQN